MGAEELNSYLNFTNMIRSMSEGHGLWTTGGFAGGILIPLESSFKCSKYSLYHNVAVEVDWTFNSSYRPLHNTIFLFTVFNQPCRSLQTLLLHESERNEGRPNCPANSACKGLQSFPAIGQQFRILLHSPHRHNSTDGRHSSRQQHRRC